MKKLISIIIFCLLFQTCVFANDNSNTYEFCKKTVEDGYGYIETEPKTFKFGDNSITCETFYYADILYIPIRDIAELIGKTVQYDSKEQKVNIYDEAEFKAPSTENTESITPSVKKFEINKIPVVYHYNTIGTYFTGYSGYNIDNIPTGFYSDGKIYVRIREIIGYFKYFYYELDGAIQIEKIPENLQMVSIPRNEYKNFYKRYEKLDDNDTRIDDSLVEKAIQIQYGLYSDPYKIEEQKAEKCLYLGKPCIYVMTEITTPSNYYRDFIAMYEVIQ